MEKVYIYTREYKNNVNKTINVRSTYLLFIKSNEWLSIDLN